MTQTMPAESRAEAGPFPTIELVRDWSSASRLAAEWDALVEESSSPSIFMTWDYVSTWWETCRDQQSLRILLARNEHDRLVGIAPLMIGTGDTLARRAVRQLSLIGAARHPISQLMDLIVRPQDRHEVARAFTRYILEDLSAEWDILHLPFIEQTSVLMRDVLPRAIEHGCTWRHNGYEPGPFARLEGSWDDYLAARSRNWRSSLRGAYARLGKAGKVELLQLGRDIDLDAALEAFIWLHDQRWGEASLALPTPAAREFLRQLAAKLAAKERLVIILMRIDGAWAAGVLDFIYRDTLFGFQGGWDPAYAHLSVGNVILAEEFKWCFERKLATFDFMGGEEPYKQRWMTDMRELVNIEVVNPRSLRGTLFSRLRNMKQALLPARATAPST